MACALFLTDNQGAIVYGGELDIGCSLTSRYWAISFLRRTPGWTGRFPHHQFWLHDHLPGIRCFGVMDAVE
jgi:hypothetical protein